MSKSFSMWFIFFMSCLKLFLICVFTKYLFRLRALFFNGTKLQLPSINENNENWKFFLYRYLYWSFFATNSLRGGVYFRTKRYHKAKSQKTLINQNQKAIFLCWKLLHFTIQSCWIATYQMAHIVFLKKEEILKLENKILELKEDDEYGYMIFLIMFHFLKTESFQVLISLFQIYYLKQITFSIIWI